MFQIRTVSAENHFFKKSKGLSYVQPLCSYYMKLPYITDARSCIVSFNLLKEELGISSGFIVQLKGRVIGKLVWWLTKFRDLFSVIGTCSSQNERAVEDID